MNERTELGCLQSEFSDFFKSFYGYRPRHLTSIQWSDVEYLKEQIQNIHDQIESLKSTFEGREELREQGWHVEEIDPDMKNWAKWLEAERSRYYDDLGECNAA
jgi:hypothetical protein